MFLATDFAARKSHGQNASSGRHGVPRGCTEDIEANQRARGRGGKIGSHRITALKLRGMNFPESRS